MACAKPLTQYRYADGTYGFSARGDVIAPNYIPCGQCMLCRLAKGAEVSTRLVHEGYASPHNVCATLTFADDKLPALGSVDADVTQAWMKRLRSRVAYRGGPELRFDLYAEYSPQKMRPHVHVCLFNYRPPDAVYWGKSRAGNPQYESAELSDSWGLGHVWFQWFSDGAASYCAGHQAWKLTGPKAFERLTLRAADGSVIGQRADEYHRCSLRPGIGAPFFEKYGRQMIQLGYTVIGGRKVPVPSYYLDLAERDPSLVDAVSELRAERELMAASDVPNASYMRLAVREECATARVNSTGRHGADSW